jgi:hypothetical protein
MKIRIILIILALTLGLSRTQKLQALGWPDQVKVCTDSAEFVLTSNDQQKWSKNGIFSSFVGF